MRTVQQIYDAYRILPVLQLHQLRVTAVAQTIIESLDVKVDEASVLLACLFHDMGNIIKSDFTIFPEFLEPEGAAHWQLIKDEFVKKYGTSSHEANVAIAKELGLPQTSVQLIDGISFSQLPRMRDEAAMEMKIVEYSDMRVSPHGVLSMQGRLDEGSRRYRLTHREGEAEYRRLVQAAYDIEQQIFAHADIAPSDITEQSVSPRIPLLRAHHVA